MSSQKYASPLHIELRSSATLTSVVVFIHVGALLCMIPLDLPLGVRLALLIAVVLSLVLTLCVEGAWCQRWFQQWPQQWLQQSSQQWLQHRANNLLAPIFKRPRFQKVVWDADDRWKFVASDDRVDEATYDAILVYDAILLPGAVVHPRLTVLNFVIDGMPWYRRRKSLVLLPDNVDASVFRRLRVRLRWYANEDPDNLAGLK